MAEDGADADAPQVQPVALPVLGGGEVVGRLGEAIDVDGRGQVVLGQGPLAEGFLNAVHGDGAGIDHPGHIGPAGYLKDVVGAHDVDLHPKVGPLLGIRGQQGRHVDDAGYVVSVHGLQQVGKLGNVATVEGYVGQVAVQGQVAAGRRQVKGHDGLAPFLQLANDAGANQAVAPGYHDGHSCSSDD